MMDNNSFETYETAWCPGCGNFALIKCVQQALGELGLKPQDVLMVGGIGQAAKLPQYIKSNSFCGLHGRALPPAVAAKIANENLTVVVSTGDGDSYGEGGNHFIHNVRRNVNITHFVHDNQIYGLTKGQASPTTGIGHVTGVQITGNINEPLNPVLMAIASGAGFAARGFVGSAEHLVSLMKQAIEYNGYALLDILQPCVSFNKINTYAYYKERVFELDESYDPSDKVSAMAKALEFGDRIPLGVIYKEEKETFHQKNEILKGKGPLIERKTDMKKVKGFMQQLI